MKILEHSPSLCNLQECFAFDRQIGIQKIPNPPPKSEIYFNTWTCG